MLFAVVARPPVVGGKVAKYDAGATMKVPGVIKVVEIAPTAGPPLYNPVGGIAVVARNTWAAIKGRDALKIEWDDGPNGSSIRPRTTTRSAAAAKEPGKVFRKVGDADGALQSAGEGDDGRVLRSPPGPCAA